MKARIAGLLLLAGVFLAGALPANGYPVTIYIEAVVDTVDDSGNYLEGKISPGSLITGYYIYESTTPDTNPSLYVGDYEHYTPPYGISLTVGGFEFKTNPLNVDFLLEIINDYTSGGLHDAYGLISYNNLPLYNGTSVNEISWWLTDTSATALSSTDLPSTAPSLDDWQSIVGLRLEGDKTFLIDAHVTSAVPEPATILLLATGALLLKRRTFKKD
jgi:hypothetical protein